MKATARIYNYLLPIDLRHLFFDQYVIDWLDDNKTAMVHWGPWISWNVRPKWSL